jgi:septal ring factor EnvC (AmiA/AmiB activator)
MKEFRYILKAIENNLAKKSEKLKELFYENDSLIKEIKRLEKENQALRDDLFELSQYYQKLKMENHGKEKTKKKN